MTRTVYRPDTLWGEAQAAVGPVAQLAGAEWSLTHRLPRDRRASPLSLWPPPAGQALQAAPLSGAVLSLQRRRLQLLLTPSESRQFLVPVLFLRLHCVETQVF